MSKILNSSCKSSINSNQLPSNLCNQTTLPSITNQQSYQIQQDLDHNHIEQISQNISLLSSANKISTKNAFILPIISIRQFSCFARDELQWKKITSALDNSFTIYGYRVDAIHCQTFKILTSLNTMSDKQTNQPSSNNQKNNIQRLKQNKNPNQQSQSKYLEKNITHITTQLNQLYQTNLLLPFNTIRSYQNSIKYLMLNIITINSNLQLSIIDNQNIKYANPTSNYNYQNHISSLLQPKIFNYCQITKKITEIKRILLSNKQQIHSQIDQQTNINQIINNQQNSYLNPILSHSQLLSRDNTFQLQVQCEQLQLNKQNQLEASIPIQLPIKQDIQQTIANQVQQKNINNKIKFNKAKRQKIFINFDVQVQERKDFLNNKIITKQNNHQLIQDKFMLPLKLVKQFNIKSLLTLLQFNQDPIYQPNDLNGLNNPIFDQFLQKKQCFDHQAHNISILQAKQELKVFLSEKKQKSFNEVYSYHKITNKDISPGVCFLTLLHLANQNQLTIHQNQDTFTITG